MEELYVIVGGQLQVRQKADTTRPAEAGHYVPLKPDTTFRRSRTLRSAEAGRHVRLKPDAATRALAR